MSDEQELAELRAEIASLRNEVARLSKLSQTPRTSSQQGVAGETTIARRSLLRTGPLLAAGAVGGLGAALGGALPAAAASNASFNNVGVDGTLSVGGDSTFFSRTTFEGQMSYAPEQGSQEAPGGVTIGHDLTDAQVIVVAGANAFEDQDGIRIDAPATGLVIDGNTAIRATTRQSTTTADAADITNVGLGRALWAKSTNAKNRNGALTGTNAGPGPGVWASSAKGDGLVAISSHNGRGARFSGAAAQIRLVPSTQATHPATGQAGDLFVDKANRLWFCAKTSTTKATWRRVV